MELKFPKIHQCLFEEKWRYINLYGGRAGLKSHSTATALLIRARQKQLRVLCCREIMNSLSESVHHLLTVKIEELGMQDFYSITDNEIRGNNGSSFIFSGLRTNISKVKSYEDIDIAWLEEAANISKNSYDILIPTIRKENSQIILTWNPELDSDETYRRFVINKPSNTISVFSTYKDNPWFTERLRQEMEDCRKNDPIAYDNIWLGNCRSAVEGAIFTTQLAKAQEDGRITDDVTYNPSIPVNTWWDLGKRNKTAIWVGQYVGQQWRMLKCISGFARNLEDYIEDIRKLPYTFNTHYLPHDAEHNRMGMQRSIQEQVELALGNAVIVPRVAHKITAIEAAKAIFPLCWFHKTDCADGLNDMRRYAYAISPDGKISQEPDHKYSDVPDAFMTFAMSAEPEIMSTNTIVYEDRSMGRLG